MSSKKAKRLKRTVDRINLEDLIDKKKGAASSYYSQQEKCISVTGNTLEKVSHIRTRSINYRNPLHKIEDGSIRLISSFDCIECNNTDNIRCGISMYNVFIGSDIEEQNNNNISTKTKAEKEYYSGMNNENGNYMNTFFGLFLPIKIGNDKRGTCLFNPTELIIEPQGDVFPYTENKYVPIKYDIKNPEKIKTIIILQSRPGLFEYINKFKNLTMIKKGRKIWNDTVNYEWLNKLDISNLKSKTLTFGAKCFKESTIKVLILPQDKDFSVIFGSESFIASKLQRLDINGIECIIYDYAFKQSSLESVTITPSNKKQKQRIKGTENFSGCIKLEYAKVPNLSQDIFRYCYDLTTIECSHSTAFEVEECKAHCFGETGIKEVHIKLNPDIPITDHILTSCNAIETLYLYGTTNIIGAQYFSKKCSIKKIVGNYDKYIVTGSIKNSPFLNTNNLILKNNIDLNIQNLDTFKIQNQGYDNVSLPIISYGDGSVTHSVILETTTTHLHTYLNVNYRHIIIALEYENIENNLYKTPENCDNYEDQCICCKYNIRGRFLETYNGNYKKNVICHNHRYDTSQPKKTYFMKLDELSIFKEISLNEVIRQLSARHRLRGQKNKQCYKNVLDEAKKLNYPLEMIHDMLSIMPYRFNYSRIN